MRLGRRQFAAALARGIVALAAGLCASAVRDIRAEDAAPAASGTAAAAVPLPFWQAPALPSAVIQGGAIPPGWQPQAVPYHGIGPDGRPLTMYFSPTYVFTYQSGPPTPAVPGAARRPPPAVPTYAPYGAYGWNYQAQGASAVPVTLPPSDFATSPVAQPPVPQQPLAQPPAQWVPSNAAPPPGMAPQQNAGLGAAAPNPAAVASPPPVTPIPTGPARR